MHREIDISRIRTAVKINAIYLDTKPLTIMPSMQSDQNGHWLPIPTQSGCTTRVLHHL